MLSFIALSDKYAFLLITTQKFKITFLKKINLFLFYVYVSAQGYANWVTSTWRSQKSTLGPLELIL